MNWVQSILYCMTKGSNVDLSYKGPRSSVDSDSDHHVDGMGTLGHMNVNLHLDYQYMHRWSSWKETGGLYKLTHSSAMYYTQHKDVYKSKQVSCEQTQCTHVQMLTSEMQTNNVKNPFKQVQCIKNICRKEFHP